MELLRRAAFWLGVLTGPAHCRRGSSGAPGVFAARSCGAGGRFLRGLRSEALAGGFVEEDGRGDGGVEALDRAGAGDGERGVGLGGQLRRQAVAFVAEEQGGGAGEVSERSGLAIARGGGEDADAGGTEAREAIIR
jgi:hypothetical protein